MFLFRNIKHHFLTFLTALGIFVSENVENALKYIEKTQKNYKNLDWLNIGLCLDLSILAG